MSKSKGEFLTLSLLEEKGYDPMVYRFFCLQSHYRKALVFSYEGLDNTKAAYDKLVARVSQLNGGGSIREEALLPFRASFREALENDLNTSLAVTALYDVLKSDLNDSEKLALIGEFDQVLSLSLLDRAKEAGKKETEETGDEEILQLVAERAEARKAKNYARADEIRDLLKSMNITVEDTPTGPKIIRK